MPAPEEVPFNPFLDPYAVDQKEPKRVVVPKERIYLEELIPALLMSEYPQCYDEPEPTIPFKPVEPFNPLKEPVPATRITEVWKYPDEPILKKIPYPSGGKVLEPTNQFIP